MCAQLARQKAFYGAEFPDEDEESEIAGLAINSGVMETYPPTVLRSSPAVEREPVNLCAELAAMGYFET